MPWLAVRLDLISITLVTTVALLIVFMHNHIPPAYAGLAICYAMQVHTHRHTHMDVRTCKCTLNVRVYLYYGLIILTSPLMERFVLRLFDVLFIISLWDYYRRGKELPLREL
jgi:hypothetical protein